MATKKTTTTKTASSAVALQAQLDLVTKERDQNLATAQQALNIANSFGGRLAVIDQAAIPFKSGGFLKTVWWVLTNFNSIVNFIKVVIEQVKAWRTDMETLQANSAQPSESNG